MSERLTPSVRCPALKLCVLRHMPQLQMYAPVPACACLQMCGVAVVFSVAIRAIPLSRAAAAR